MIDVDRYELIEKLFEGKNCAIYRGRHKANGERVILKCLRSDLPTAEARVSFKREYEIQHSLADIPGVVKVHRLEKSGAGQVMVMEDFGGVSLSAQMAPPPLDLEEFLSLAVTVVEIVATIHQKNVIHKNINPSNIIRNRETGEIKLIDFGIASKISTETRATGADHKLEGNLRYISPEQTGRMNRSLDNRTDFYSLGITLYELLTGKPPFESKDPLELVHCHMAKIPVPAHEAIKKATAQQGKTIETPDSPIKGIEGPIPPAVSGIINRLLEKDAENRYQTAFSLKADLRNCLRQLKEKGTVAPFPPGENEIPDRFRIPQKLYGRQNELDMLLSVSGKTEKGGAELVLVSGYSGVGKSSLVAEVYKNMARKQGHFVKGKSDQFQRDVPYHAIRQAFGRLMSQLLQQPEEEFQEWRKQLQETLGPNGGIIVDLIPETEKIIGLQPPVPELNPTETHNRFRYTFTKLVKLFARPGLPLTLFLDDLQWSDVPSLKLLEHLLCLKEIGWLLVIGAYRDNEVSEGHPLMLTAAEIEKHNRLHRLAIQPLTGDIIHRITTDTLHCDTDTAEPLSQLIYTKTGGNPFFAVELLKTLHCRGLIYFLPADGYWTWDLEKIKTTDISDNVVKFMVRRLNTLPETTRRVLQLAACMGNSFDFKTLSYLDRRPDDVTADALREAVDHGIIVPLSNYHLLDLWKSDSGESFPDFQVEFQFSHDRLQQAAYQLTAPQKRQEVHVGIGRLMLLHKSEAAREEDVVEIVGQFNKGPGLLEDADERLRVANLNCLAGSKAKAATAYLPALQYFGIAKQLLPKNPWQNEYRLTTAVYKGACECAYLCSRFDEAEALCNILLQQAQTRLEKAEIRNLQLIHYSFHSKMGEAVTAALLGLKELGFNIPEHPGKGAIIKELMVAKWNMRGRTVSDILRGPQIENPEIKCAIKLLVYLNSPSFLSGRENLFALGVLKQTNLALRHGNCNEAAAAFAYYAVLLAGMGDLQGTFDFGDLALKISDRFNEPEWRCVVMLMFGLFGRSWNLPWDTQPQWFRECIDTGLQTGSSFFTAHAAVYVTLWDPGLDVDTAIKRSQQYAALIEDQGHESTLAVSRLVLHRWLNMAGRTAHRLTFNSENFDEKNCLEGMKQNNYMSGVAIYYAYQIQLNYFYENSEGAVQYIAEADAVIKALAGSPFLVEYALYVFLTYAALYPAMDGKEKKQAMKRMKKEYKRMKTWGNHFSHNFSHHVYLMEAQLATLKKEYVRAVDCYNRAIRAAEQNGGIRYQALNNELAAKFYLTGGDNRIGTLYLQEARKHYHRWGAVEKATFLEEKYPSFPGRSEKSAPESDDFTSRTSSEAVKCQMLDLSTIIKASQAISKEIDLEELLKKIMRIVIENTGAQKGYLLLRDHQRWTIAVEGILAGSTYRTVPAQPVENSGLLSTSVFHFVTHMRQSVVLNDAAADDTYAHDTYIKRQQPRSLLCAPLLSYGELIGVWYLENNLNTGVFTGERTGILDLLSAQVAISLENARMYRKLDELNKNLEQTVAERTRELVQLKNARMKAELKAAQEAQLSIMPDADPQVPGYDISGICIPTTEVGGDFFDYLWLDEEKTQMGIVIGDVSGKSMKAAMTAILSCGIISADADGAGSLTEIMNRVNRHLYAKTERKMFTALCLPALDTKRKQMTFINAGLNDVFLLRKGEGTFIRGEGARVPLGIMKQNDYREKVVPLETDDVLVFFTDGITESHNEDGEFYGTQSLAALLTTPDTKKLTASQIKETIIKDVQAFVAGSRQNDDITLVVVKVTA